MAGEGPPKSPVLKKPGHPKKPAVQWFAERTSMHGVPALIQSHSKKSKTFWAVVCLLGLGMFLYMLISLFINYFSYPTVIKVEQVPKGMTQPWISFCNKRFASMMTELSIAKVARVSGTNFSMPLDARRENATRELINLLISLHEISGRLDLYHEHGSTMSNLTKAERKTLDKWAEVRTDLLQRWLVTTLLTTPTSHASGQFKRLRLLQDKRNETTLYCGTNHRKCNLGYISPFIGVNQLNCFKYNVMEGEDWVESRAQGIENGITFIFMTASKLLASGLDIDSVYKIPGYSNTFTANTGSEGIQVIIHSPFVSPMPNLDSVDIAPGMSTEIGITSRENIRLPNPYGECASKNIEGKLLMESVKAKLGYEPQAGAGMMESRYTAGACRGTCMLRHIWEHCGCLLMSESLPFFNSSLSCGQINSTILLEAQDNDDAGTESCFSLGNMATEYCKEKLGKLFDDLSCVRSVFKKQARDHDDEFFQCNCPMPCYSQEYDLTIGTSRWPSPGPELDSAYSAIVMNKLIPYFRKFNHTMTGEVVKYLSDKKNKFEIMENFARLTVYIKSLKVEKITEIADYTLLDLFSDIGGQLGLWVGISAITLCEIFGFLSLAVKNTILNLRH